MNFADPQWFLGLGIIPVIWYFYNESIKKKKKAAIKFSNLNLIKLASGNQKKTRRNEILFAIHILLLISLITALADPHLPLKQTKEGVNVVLAIDVSGSMAANDYQPTRLESAKKSAKILIKELHSKDDIGIVIFSDGATTSAYLSPDKSRTLDKLESIKEPKGATAIGDGLALAVDMATSIPNKKRVIILLSDGVNNAGVINPDEAIQFAKMNNIQVYTIGMGSEKPVLLGYDWFGRPQYAQLDEATLQKIAKETGGEYFKSVDSSTLDKIYRDLPKKIKRERESTSIKDWFVILTIIILLVELYLRFGKYRVLP